MSFESVRRRIERIEREVGPRRERVRVEDLTDEQLREMTRKSGYDLTLLTDAELTELRDCYTDAGDYLPERMTPELAAALERVKL